MWLGAWLSPPSRLHPATPGHTRAEPWRELGDACLHCRCDADSCSLLAGGSEMVGVQLDCPSFPGDIPHPPAKSGVYALQVRTGRHVPAQPRVILRRQKAFVMGRIHVGRAKSHQLLVVGVPFTKTKRGLTPAGCLLCARHRSWGCDLTRSPLVSSGGHGGAPSGGKGTPGQQPQAVGWGPGPVEQGWAAFSPGLSGKSELRFCLSDKYPAEVPASR